MLLIFISLLKHPFFHYANSIMLLREALFLRGWQGVGTDVLNTLPNVPNFSLRLKDRDGTFLFKQWRSSSVSSLHPSSFLLPSLAVSGKQVSGTDKS